MNRDRVTEPGAGTPRALRVGVVGLGIMGVPMAANLLRQPLLTVTVHHRSRERVASLLAAGAHWAGSARELAEQSDVIVVMVPDLPEVEVLLAGDDGLLAGVAEPLTLVVCSSVSPEGVRELADRLSRETDGRVRVVDAPVSGGEDGARVATLSIFVGGSPDDVAGVMPVLEVLGRPVHLGPLGAGEVAKACNQLIVASTVLALGEAAAIAGAAGLDVGQLFDLLEGGYAGSRVLQTRKRRFVERDYEPSGPARYLVKDLGFALQEAGRTAVSADYVAFLHDTFVALVDAGLGDLDMAVTREFVETRPTDTHETTSSQERNRS